MAFPVRIGNAQGFWGDSVDAPARLVAQQPDIDYLTLDYLAEVSLSIMAMQRHRDPSLGYARDFVDVLRSLAPMWRGGRKLKVIANAGGLNPRSCAEACIAALRESGCAGLTIGIVAGDDVLPEIRRVMGNGSDASIYANFETGEPLATIANQLVTAHAYIGAGPVVEALAQGADIVITGRVADPSMVVAAAMYHHGWKTDDFGKLAGATIAGHLIECGTQVCGGIATEWLRLPDPAHIGFPFVEIDADGSCIVSKPIGTGGRVTPMTVKEQLLYEIGDPGNYLSPDCRVSLLGIRVDTVGNNRVRVSGAIGNAPTSSYKVSATYRDGFWAQGMLTIVGRDAVEKAKRCGEIVFERVRDAGFELARTNIECLGANGVAPSVLPAVEPLEVVLRLSAADPRKDALERFSKELAPLVTSGPQGVTGYAAGRPKVHPVFGYWPCLVPRDCVTPTVEIMTL